MRVLALDSALARCSAAVLQDATLLADRHEDLQRGQAARLPVLVQTVLAEAGLDPTSLDLIAVTVGPGSFTGIRAGLALAHGMGMALQRPVIGVSVGEALAAAWSGSADRPLWCAVDSRRGRVFLEHDGQVVSCPLDRLPAPPGPIAVAGDAAIALASRLAAAGHDVLLTDLRLPTPQGVARAAAQRAAGTLPPRPAQPLYVDPPEVRLPAGGLRPPPMAA